MNTLFPHQNQKLIKVQSFTKPNKFYIVDVKNQTCSCPSFKANKYCKHLQFIFGENINKQGKISVSLLKSNLQKAVRERDVEKAIRSAKSLMNMDLLQFLRRLPIIIIEDAILHPKMVEIIEILKKVSKNKFYQLSEDEKDLLINIVAEVAEIDIVDIWVDEEMAKELKQFEDENIEKLSQLNDDERNLILALKYRASIGGMKGDIEMLTNYSRLWFKRFLTKEWSVEKLASLYKSQNLKFNEVKEADKDDIILRAIDIHCSPLTKILLKKDEVKGLMLKTFPNYQGDWEQKLKEILWRNLIGINKKKVIGSNQYRSWYKILKINKEEEERERYFFTQIKGEVENIQRWFLNRI